MRSCTSSVLSSFSNCVLEHVYAGRPPSAQTLISGFTSRPSPRPSILHLADLAPPTTAYSISHSALLLIAVSGKDAQSLAILDFLLRLVDVFEDFLGSPLLANKIEDNYEIVAQLLAEMCDGGIVCNTEPNALRESVEVSSGLGKLFSHVGLPRYVLFRLRNSDAADFGAPHRLLDRQAVSHPAYDPLILPQVGQQFPGANPM